MLKWEPRLKRLHRSRMRVVGYKSLVLTLQRFGGLDNTHLVVPTYLIIAAYAFGGLGALEGLEVLVFRGSSRDARLEVLDNS